MAKREPTASKRKDIENYLFARSREKSKKTGEPITRDVINLEIAALKQIFKRLVSERYLRENPAIEIKRLDANDRKFYFISKDEEKLYLMACPQPLQDVASLMFETGMRPTEIYNLSRKNVFVEKDFLNVENGKTKCSNRRIWLSNKAADILRRRLDRFKGEFLFPQNDVDGEPPTGELHKKHRQAIASFGVKFRLYDCRHTFATRALESGTDLLTLAALLGHADLSEVMRYAHPSEESKSNAIKRMSGRAKAV